MSKVVFECVVSSNSTIIPAGRIVKVALVPFIGKKVKVTVETIKEVNQK